MSYKYRYTNIPSVLQGDVPEWESYSYMDETRTVCECDFHHIFGQTKYKKKLSEQYGFWVWLTREDHDNLHHTPAGKQYEKTLKQQCQEIFEMSHSREMWMRLFHRNYL